MKKIMMIAVMAIAALTANAQQEAGTFSIAPKAGLTVNNINGSDIAYLDNYASAVTGLDISKKMLAGFTAGLDMTYQASESFALEIGAYYQQAGCKFKVAGASDNIKMKLGYVTVPVLANYYLVKGLAVKAGLQPALLTTANITVAGESVGGFKSDCNKMALSIPVGFSYEYANFIFDARYSFGLTHVVKDAKNRSNSFVFTLGYKIGL